MSLTLALTGGNLGAGTGRAARRGRPPPMVGMRQLPGLPALSVTGVTRDSNGNALAACEVELYRRSQDQTNGTYVNRATSDGSGNYSFRVGLGQTYQTLAYQTGSPDVAGATVRTQQGG